MSWRSQGRVAAANLRHWGRVRLRVRPTLSPGLLVRLRRPSVARAARSRGGKVEGLRPRCSRAGGLPPKPEQPHRNALPRGLPGSAIVWSPPRCRMVVPAQWRARHAPVSGGSAVPSIGRLEACPTIGPAPVGAPGETLSTLYRIAGSRRGRLMKCSHRWYLEKCWVNKCGSVYVARISRRPSTPWGSGSVISVRLG